MLQDDDSCCCCFVHELMMVEVLERGRATGGGRSCPFSSHGDACASLVTEDLLTDVRQRCEPKLQARVDQMRAHFRPASASRVPRTAWRGFRPKWHCKCG